MSDFLFARPSLLSGAARTLDLFGTFTAYNESPSEAIADAVALATDWHAVGDDIQSAAENVSEEMDAEEAVGA